MVCWLSEVAISWRKSKVLKNTSSELSCILFSRRFLCSHWIWTLHASSRKLLSMVCFPGDSTRVSFDYAHDRRLHETSHHEKKSTNTTHKWMYLKNRYAKCCFDLCFLYSGLFLQSLIHQFSKKLKCCMNITVRTPPPQFASKKSLNVFTWTGKSNSYSLTLLKSYKSQKDLDMIPNRGSIEAILSSCTCQDNISQVR